MNEPDDIDLLTTLRTHVAAHYGNQRRAAAAWGVTQQFVSLVLTGKCPPNDVILDDVGLVRVVVYRKSWCSWSPRQAPVAPPYQCRYCGAPSWLEPIDQCAPPDYCHPPDHGAPDEE